MPPRPPSRPPTRPPTDPPSARSARAGRRPLSTPAQTQKAPAPTKDGPGSRPRARPLPRLSPGTRRAELAAAMAVAPQAVPDDTLARLDTLLELLARWTRRINLVGPATLPDAWRRHVLDSARLWPHGPAGARRLADLGSGAGFPGLVLAILGAADVHLVESDQRKAAFLREAARVTGTPVTVHPMRLETLAPLDADVVTARALAPLPDLLGLVVRHLAADGVAVLPKGRDVARELTACADRWIMRVQTVSGSDPVPVPVPDPVPDRDSDPDPESRPDRDPPGPLLILREIRRAASPS